MNIPPALTRQTEYIKSCLACRFVLIILLLLMPYIPAHGEESGNKAIVIISSRIRPYLDALEGFKSTFMGEVESFDLSSNSKLAKHMLENGDYSIAVSIGPGATDMIWQAGTEIPRFACMVLDLENHTGKRNACGIDLRVPIERQLDSVKSHLPYVKNMGIIFNPDENSNTLDRAMAYADSLDIKIIPMPVDSATRILPLLEKTLAMISMDALLFIPDSTVTSSRMLIQHIIKAALLKHVAVIGYNSFFIRTGAVLAFVIDYREIGAMTGEKANDMLNGSWKCGIIPPRFSTEWNRKVWKRLSSVNGRNGQ